MAKAWKFIETKSGDKVKVDAEDLDRISKHSWRVVVSGKNEKRSVVTSIRTKESVRTMTLGQFILKPRKGMFVYPRRWQEALDYRKQNLIICKNRLMDVFDILIHANRCWNEALVHWTVKVHGGAVSFESI